MRLRLADAALALALAFLCVGCASSLPRNPVPEVEAATASVPGMDGIRFWGDEVPRDIVSGFHRSGVRQLAESQVKENGKPVVNYLALSGGADDGAFGAGLLVGWSQTNRRPRFEVVTGISAGALIAPFAFLGPAHDKDLRDMWVRYEASDLYVKEPLAGLFGGPAFADSAPLAARIADYIDKPFLEAVAREYRRGRLLLVGTTNLDSQRLVVWNMGKIAASGHPDALALFRRVLLASASIPGVFPPVRISVAADGKIYDEMHVDGGVTAQVFLAPVQLSLRELDKLHTAPPSHRIFVIRNAKLSPEFKAVKASSFAIAGRAISTLTYSQSKSDVLRIYVLAQRSKADFNLAAIPADFMQTSENPFDRDYMRALFRVGFERGRHGYDWMKVPPELVRGW